MMFPWKNLQKRWDAPAGYREVLKVAIPLALSTSSWSIQHFVDRMFLCWYDAEAMAAAMSAGIFAFAFMSFFMGLASYTNTFVAQYDGAGKPKRIGASIWQSLYACLAAALLIPIPAFFASFLFGLTGHPESLQALEIPYFRIILFGGPIPIFIASLSCFYSGRGKTLTVMWVHFAVTAINLLLDYMMIFGVGPFPEMGIIGGAWATNIANTAGMLIFVALVFQKKHEAHYGTRTGWKFNSDLFYRLIRYGAPSGIHFVLDMSAFTMFFLLVGRIGQEALAATTIAIQINTLAFMPMIGFGIAAATLVGQYLGAEKPETAEKATWSIFHITMLYTLIFFLLYLLTPGIFIAPFASNASGENFAAIEKTARNLLYFVAVFCVCDAMNLIFAHAIKGAGDTRFVMFWSVVFGWCIMALPTWVSIQYFDRGIYTAWAFITSCIILMGTVFFFRFMGGKWKSMRVIEKEEIPLAPPVVNMPETPVE